MRRLFLFAILAITLLGCMRHDGSGHRSLASQSAVNDVDRWIVAWLGQAPAMSEWITLSKIQSHVCSASRR